MKGLQKKNLPSFIRIFAAGAMLLLIAILTVLILRQWHALSEAETAYEKISETQGTREDLKALAEKNPEVIGWLTVEDTRIDTPVVQGDDNIKYINKDINGDDSFAGCPFLDCRNSAGLEDRYSVIYGHYMEDGLMFGDLAKFRDPEFWKEARQGTFIRTDGEHLSIAFFACTLAKENDSRIFDPLRVRNNWNEEGFTENMLSECIYKIEEIDPEDRIVALSTCTSADSEERIVVFGKVRS